MLNRDEILSKNELKKNLIHVPEWGGDVIVQELSAGQRDEYEMKMLDMRNGETRINIRALVASKCIVDDAGECLFNEADVNDLAKLSASALDKIFQVILELSGMGESDEENEKND